ncbi:TetR/AcrR family transcriptional regulator [Paenibacillus sp. P46E]|uniref:TetR/AcrR family transcriptional regulator n=1 Tax=Paenibacillus sp. P46E TaxID=1349436 RepID=UPI00093AB28E|nr:TetR/AcrR family transcriptional regulator [Paenibacillus sp. P46E]OKP98637.1 TetR family transcriptional regulator [Paenibacillus sp. P46E]
MNKKTDLRIIRSKHSIKKAFIELLTEKGYEGITIQDIADKAMISRNTFYLHYQNKPDLLNASMDELIEELKSTLKQCSSSKTPVSGSMLEQLMQTILEKIQGNIPFYKALLLDENRIHGFQAKMEEIIKNTVEVGLDNTPLKISKELLLQYIASTFMGIVVWWVKNDFSYTPKELASQFGKILTHGHLKAAGISIND